MKNKIIAIILCIAVISSIFVISCFATIETLETNVTYDYVASYTRIDAPAGVYNNYQGRYIGIAYDKNNYTKYDLDINFVSVKTYDGNTLQKRWLTILDSDNNEYYIQINGDYPVSAKITFTSIGSNSYINTFLLSTLTVHVNTFYDDTYELHYFQYNNLSMTLYYPLQI